MDELVRFEQQSMGEDVIKASSKGTVSNWETGRRSLSPERVRQIAIALGLSPDEQDAMIGMWRAAGSTSALPPRVRWEHNYHPEADRRGDPCAQGGPAWVWLRCGPGDRSVTVSVGWAPWGEDFTVPVTRTGMLIHAPASLPNPALQVTFSTPSWADFGNGIVPPDVVDRLQIKAVDGTTLSRGRFVDPPELDEAEIKEVKPDLDAMQGLSGKFNVLWQQIKPQLGAMRPSSRVQPLDGAQLMQTNWMGVLRTDDRGELVDQLLQMPEQIKAIRKLGRSLSAEAAAQGANTVEPAGVDDQITANQIETLERSGTLPDSARIIARLDHVYELDGYLGIERVFSSRTARIDQKGLCAIRFPDFWVGPVWLQIRAPERPDQETVEAALNLYWGYWRRLQLVKHGTIVTTRKAVADGEKLMVHLPRGWSLAAGTGAVPAAIDINHDWYPASFTAAAKLIYQGFKTLKDAGRL